MARPRGVSTGKERLVEAAGRSFRLGGFGGTGIDTVAREAGLTSGAFYAHFGSKAKAFRSALVDGLDFLDKGLAHVQAEHGANWHRAFVDFYLGERLAVDLSQACALPTFSADAARADAATRTAYQERLAPIVERLATGFGGEDGMQRGWALLSILVGAAAMARAVEDETMRAAIVSAAREVAYRV
ncbi:MULTISPECIES: TetR/AcrR family transcriptional regulator [Sphingomonas]|uniref:TetR/AcrR family transcriptional regulator n=1 Tax=Sphingomonas TaxID=13687 RepID=UPI00082CC523|nr:TetR/AcrR family transcriptional regulator [Sphingomonas sp. CCH10-B3]